MLLTVCQGIYKNWVESHSLVNATKRDSYEVKAVKFVNRSRFLSLHMHALAASLHLRQLRTIKVVLSGISQTLENLAPLAEQGTML